MGPRYKEIVEKYPKLNHPLCKFFNSEATDISKPEAARVFADALQGYFRELMAIAKDIDAEYSSHDSELLAAKS